MKRTDSFDPRKAPLSQPTWSKYECSFLFVFVLGLFRFNNVRSTVVQDTYVCTYISARMHADTKMMCGKQLPDLGQRVHSRCDLQRRAAAPHDHSSKSACFFEFWMWPLSPFKLLAVLLCFLRLRG
jgi:hypothetical protein